MNRRNWLAAALTGAGWGVGQAQVPAWSLDARRRLLGGTQAGSADRLSEAAALTEAGESALAAGRFDEAERAFDAAAQIVHSADVEMGLVRTYMQAGDYRRALTFAAHAAGAHRQVPGATALYGWLLCLGGQGLAAQRFVGDALASFPADAALLEVHSFLQGTPPVLSPALLAPPLRAAPYASGAEIPPAAEAWCSAVLLAGGRQAVAPAAGLGDARRLWVRNGMGQTRVATVLAGGEPSGLLHLQLDAALPDAPLLLPLLQEPFAGSPFFMFEFQVRADAVPAWPRLQQGFFGRSGPVGAPRSLVFDASPSACGGPVFDAAGKLAGLAAFAREVGGHLLPATSFARLATHSTERPLAAPPTARVAVDSLYETGMRVALQVLRLA